MMKESKAIRDANDNNNNDISNNDRRNDGDERVVVPVILYPPGGAFNKLRAQQSNYLLNLLNTYADGYRIDFNNEEKHYYVQNNILNKIKLHIYVGDTPKNGKLTQPNPHQAFTKISQLLRNIRKQKRKNNKKLSLMMIRKQQGQQIDNNMTIEQSHDVNNENIDIIAANAGSGGSSASSGIASESSMLSASSRLLLSLRNEINCLRHNIQTHRTMKVILDTIINEQDVRIQQQEIRIKKLESLLHDKDEQKINEPISNSNSSSDSSSSR